MIKSEAGRAGGEPGETIAPRHFLTQDSGIDPLYQAPPELCYPERGQEPFFATLLFRGYIVTSSFGEKTQISSLSLSMQPQHFRMTVFAVMLALLGGGPLAEIVHQDANPGSSASEVSMTEHTCGDTEHHIPADRLHQCVSCSHRTQRLSTLLSLPPLSISSIASLADLPCLLASSGTASFLFSGKRGPPRG